MLNCKTKYYTHPMKTFQIIKSQGSPTQTHIAISLNRGTNLLRPRGDCELGFAFESFVECLFGQGGSSAHVLITGVGAASNQTCNVQPQSVCVWRGAILVNYKSLLMTIKMGQTLNHWPTLTSRGQPFFSATDPMSETGWARSGVNGPLMWGFSCKGVL